MRRPQSDRGRGDRGYAVIWALGVTWAMIGFVGLVVDGGNILRARSDAHSVASAAARVGAQELDLPTMLAPGYEGDPVIDEAEARAAVEQYLTPRDVDLVEVSVSDDGNQILVEVAQEVGFQILLRSGETRVVRMEATARAAEP